VTPRVFYESVIRNENRATLIKREACYQFIAERSQQALRLILKFHQQVLVYQDILEGQSNRWYGRGLVQLSNCALLGSFKNSLDL